MLVVDRTIEMRLAWVDDLKTYGPCACLLIEDVNALIGQWCAGYYIAVDCLGIGQTCILTYVQGSKLAPSARALQCAI